MPSSTFVRAVPTAARLHVSYPSTKSLSLARFPSLPPATRSLQRRYQTVGMFYLPVIRCGHVANGYAGAKVLHIYSLGRAHAFVAFSDLHPSQPSQLLPDSC